MTLMERLRQERLFCDGGTGTFLQERGLGAGELPENWNLSKPEEIIAMHSAYLEAGCHIITTNSFGANALKFPENLDAIVTAAVQHVQTARAKAGRETDAFVALNIGPTGKLLAPLGDLPFERAVELFSQTIKIGARAGADLVLIETMSDSLEAKAAILAAKESCELPVFATVAFDEKGKLLTGGTVASTVALFEGLRVDAMGVNCGMGPDKLMPMVAEMLRLASIPVIVNPNAGLPRSENGKTVFDLMPDAFARQMAEIADMGACVLGGCCGTTPTHLRALIAACKGKPQAKLARKSETWVSSFSQCVQIGEAPIIVGERINPTGKKKLKEALRAGELEYLVSEGLMQEEAGAHVLDVNVGLPEIDEPAMMETVIPRLQSVIALPLQIDTSDMEAMERGLRIYNGKPMINSVSGKAESMHAVFPLVQRYGGVVVGLTLDEGGIPDNAEDRVKIARKIYDTAAQYGIDKKDIVIDALAMTISSDQESAAVTLETLRRIRDELGGHTILGVSNISFGLPNRQIINSTFFALAMQMGLSCAIMNPASGDMMRAYHSYLALMGYDAQCMQYISLYANVQPAAMSAAVPIGTSASSAAAQGGSMNLYDSILKGLKESAVTSAQAALATRQSLSIINEDVIPALDAVGKAFEKGSMFLPQLLMSAEATKAAFEVIKQQMGEGGAKSAGEVILATVKGDIHDIGKNIVKVLLENYGFDVIDLGKDVEPELILQTAREREIKLVGLSALMTTTVVNMEKTIALLHQELPKTKIVVGGAVLTQDYADDIGADCYAKDAMATVKYAQAVFS